MTLEELRAEAEKLGCQVKPLKKFVFGDLSAGEVFEYTYGKYLFCAMKLESIVRCGLFHDDSANAVRLSDGALIYMNFNDEVVPVDRDLIFKPTRSVTETF